MAARLTVTIALVAGLGYGAVVATTSALSGGSPATLLVAIVLAALALFGLVVLVAGVIRAERSSGEVSILSMGPGKDHAAATPTAADICTGREEGPS